MLLQTASKVFANRQKSIESQVQLVRVASQRLAPLSATQLESAANDHRDGQFNNAAPSQSAIDGLALVFEALRRTVGIELYDVQIMAALTVAESSVAEMQTGEGKTFVAAAGAMVGRRID